MGIRYRFKLKYGKILVAIAMTFISIACSNMVQPYTHVTTNSTPKVSELNIWWEQGFNIEEDEAIRTIVNNWQQQTGNRVKLSFFTNDELTAKAERAIAAGHPPDIMMNPKAEKMLYPRLAWEGKLEDVSDILEPIQNSYPQNVLQAVTYSNSVDNKRSYYGVPIYQTILSIFYWQKLLALAGLNSEDIPRNWDGFWQFWQQAQKKLQTEQDKQIYALGLSISGNTVADDTHYLFDQILEAYDVDLFDAAGELAVSRPQIRQGIIQCLKWYAQLYQQGYIPPNAVEWSNADNNRSLLNQMVLMTPNATLSIPATVRQDRETYYNQLGITPFPDKPSGQPMRYLVSIRQTVIFKDSRHKSLAKDFLRYLIQPQVTIEYLKATNSRNQPVQKSVWSNTFWQNTSDPYIATVTKILTKGSTRLSDVVEHPAYSQVLADNIWGQALTRVTVNGISPTKAADEAIAKIEKVFRVWK
jgi:multiple sugar transport system substrate-binding protein